MGCFRGFVLKFKSSKGKKGGRCANNNKAGADENVPDDDGSGVAFRVVIPDNVKPGDEFQVYAGNRLVQVRCPLDSRPGRWLKITDPADGPIYAHPDSIKKIDNMKKIKGSDNNPKTEYLVRIPKATGPGEVFHVRVGGQYLKVACPPKARGGMLLRIIPPPEVATQQWEVKVPNGVPPGSSFALMAGGMRVFIKCPSHTGPGQRLRFCLAGVEEPVNTKRTRQKETNLLARMNLLVYCAVRSLFSRLRISKKHGGNKAQQGMQSEEMTVDSIVLED